MSLPPGAYYLSQASPNETVPWFNNSAVTVVTNNVDMAGAGESNTTLIAYNRATTLFSVGRSPQSYLGCSNIILRDMTLRAQPHLAVFEGTNTTFELGALAGGIYTGD